MPRGKPSLSREQILAVALQLVDTEGVACLTMRSLADKLGVGTMSIYYHLPDKAALLDAVVEQALSSIEVPQTSDGCNWVEQVRSFALGFRAACQAHPNVLPLILSRRVKTARVVRPIESVLKSLREAGFSTEDTLFAFRTLIGYTVGSMCADLTGPLTETPNATRAEVAQQCIERLDKEFPYLIEVTTHIAKTEAEQEFQYGLELIIAGLKARQASSVIFLN
ncbi:TetR/AcrR family transcriptional regulator C-terminal domain-containing protein [Iningainema tapete]|uniref:TetR/AcrR family transcriptional regulator C-terminal domain-containing protein n=1 Tax=Iningainema tapete BLCC-T55 TaxID=2748662 RepID=A0A8J7BYK8_9CYAN|nr:TetR/AcrR family transcriptional regulator C-terminal domain-containing protein [Iningainema tapete BLCC-T55]